MFGLLIFATEIPFFNYRAGYYKPATFIDKKNSSFKCKYFQNTTFAGLWPEKRGEQNRKKKIMCHIITHVWLLLNNCQCKYELSIILSLFTIPTTAQQQTPHRVSLSTCPWNSYTRIHGFAQRLSIQMNEWINVWMYECMN